MPYLCNYTKNNQPMKRLFTFILTLLAVITIQAGILTTDTRTVPGIVHYADGHQETFQSITIPPSGAKKFTAKNEAGKKVTIQAVDVEYLELWHPKAPEESRDVLWCCISKKADGSKKLSGWSFIIGEGKHLNFYTCQGVYYMTKTGLVMRVKGDSLGPNVIYRKPDISTEYQHFGLMEILKIRSKTVVKRLVEEVISDDPALCKTIQEKDWKGKVLELLEYVAGTYNPQK